MTRDTVAQDRQLQVTALYNSQAGVIDRKRCFSLRSFYNTDDSGSDDDRRSLHKSTMSKIALFDYPLNKRGHAALPTSQLDNKWASESDLVVNRSFRRRVKKMAKKERKRSLRYGSDDDVEIDRSAPLSRAQGGKAGGLSHLARRHKNKKRGGNTERRDINELKHEFEVLRVKLFGARTAIDVQPELIDHTRQVIEFRRRRAEQTATDGLSPGVYSLRASRILHESQLGLRNGQAPRSAVLHISEERMKLLIAQSRNDIEVNQHLLYNPKYDTKWRNRYTDIFHAEDRSGKKCKRPDNKKGWVLPLKRVCDKVGISSKFFTNNREMELPEARATVLRRRLALKNNHSDWLTSLNGDYVKNEPLEEFLVMQMDVHTTVLRLEYHNASVAQDCDRVKIAGQFYNNVQLGKRMFGKSKQEKFASSITGGMERRFEILDNQVNHMVFTHEYSDANPQKCRNQRVKCRDSTRVIVSADAGGVDTINVTTAQTTSTFIHANWVEGGSLFNRFILTQAPMDETIADFWRMVWQERTPYIFMLISRKDPQRCADYWPKHSSDEPLEIGGLRIENEGVDSTRDPLFRVTLLRITGPGDELRVEHWQGNMNNSSNVFSPLTILDLARSCSQPVVIHDCLGISRAACVVAAELAICNLLKGPTYQHTIQQAIQFLRSKRPFCIETPMQYIYVHRIVEEFFKPIAGEIKGLKQDYQRWLAERGKRMFIDDLDSPIPGFRLLSPKVDPDLLRQVRRPERPNIRREAPDCVGEMPLPLEEDLLILSKARRELKVEKEDEVNEASHAATANPTSSQENLPPAMSKQDSSTFLKDKPSTSRMSPATVVDRSPAAGCSKAPDFH